MSAVERVRKHCITSFPDIASMDAVEPIEKFMMGLSTLLVFSFNFDTTGVGNAVTNLAIACFMATELMACLSRRYCRLHPVTMLFAAFTWFCLCSVLWSPSFDRSIARVKSLLLMLLYFIALTNFALAGDDHRGRCRAFARSLVISSLFAAVYVIVASDWRTGTRVTGVIGDSNQASAYLSYAVPVALYCGEKKLLPRLLVAADIVAVSFAVVVMASRTGLIVVAAGLVLYWFVRAVQRGFFTLRSVTELMVILIAIYGIFRFIMTDELAYELIGSRYESFIDIAQGQSSKINENSYYERRALRDLAIKLFERHPIGGVGIEAYSYYAALTIRDTFSHNDYLQLLSCVGVVGFCLYYSQHVYIAVRLPKLQPCEFALGFVLLIQMFSFHTNVVFYYQKLEFVFLAFLVALVSIDDNQHIPSPQHTMMEFVFTGWNWRFTSSGLLPRGVSSPTAQQRKVQ